ncbi:unnamed protein product [Lymnaea stagnalis]|uniref:Rho GTPase-activating protein 12 n=1 Tax=Lymnaea stagnalis TaxID=6523 RepID=A0AAV2HP53_LYMST
MADETEEVVKVLYDYTYSDDSGKIEIKADDVYRLIEKTNSEWWQVYDPSDYDGESFFVPAQYVKIVSEKSPWKALSDLDKILTFGADSTSSISESSDTDEDTNSEPSNSKQNESENSKPPVQDKNKLDEGEYVNLDMYRDAAGIQNPVLSGKSATEPPKNCTPATKPPIPQELIQGSIPPPLPSEATFVKVLVKDLPWDIYKEHSAGRNFYVNRETGERMWKPPRKDKPSSTEPPKTPELSSPDSATGSKVGEWTGIPPEYEQVHDNGSVYFIHKSTQEKWKSLVDKVGRKYFHKVGSADTLWTLPTSSNAPDKDLPPQTTDQTVQQRDVNWESQGHRLSTFGGKSLRATKAMSTYGHLDSPNILNRASTLPANLNSTRVSPVANDRSRSPTQMPSPNNIPQRPTNLYTSNMPLKIQEDPFEGYLNKAKIVEGTGKKKVKKNWSQIYLVLQETNLIFYKDQKSTAHKPGSPHGRPEMVVSLQGAKVEFKPSKEFTSKKNTILLHANSGIFLLQSDNEKNIREWFTRLKIIANDMSPVPESSPRDFDNKDDKKSDKGMTRSVSADDSPQSVDRKKNMVGIGAKLKGLLNRRPTKDDLIKQGILKDAVFGSKLQELCDRDKNNVPKFVHACIAAVEKKGLSHDGLYRISGNMAEIQRLRCAVDKDDSYNLYDEQWDIHVLTGALKLFFRELKEPVFPFNMYNKFLDAIKKELKTEKLSLFKAAVADLPRCNYHTLKELFQHLHKVVEVSHRNRMQTQNIAIVFGPTLLWQEEDGGSLAVQTVYQSKIVEYMLLELNELFK